MSRVPRPTVPTALAIAKYWYEHQPSHVRMVGFLWEPACMACGWFQHKHMPEIDAESQDEAWDRAKLEKCHIIPHALGGSSDASNLVLLCAACHLDSPDVDNPQYMIDWIASKEDNTYQARCHRALHSHPEYRALMDELMARSGDVERALEYAGEYALTHSMTHHGSISPGTYAAAGIEGLRRAVMEDRAESESAWCDDLLGLMELQGGVS